jgi:hypothetical protein
MTGTHPGSTADPTDELHRCRCELADARSRLEELAEARHEDEFRRAKAEHAAILLSEALCNRLRTRPRMILGGLTDRRHGRPRADEVEQVRLLNLSGLMDGPWYLRRYPESAASGLEPALHYLREGAAAGHDPGPRFSTDAYRVGHAELESTGENPLVHYLRTSPGSGGQPPR